MEINNNFNENDFARIEAFYNKVDNKDRKIMNTKLDKLITEQDLSISELVNDICDIIIEKYGTHNFDAVKNIINSKLETESKFKFDVNRDDLYKNDDPELMKRTKKRLTEMAECGMEEVMTAEFGYKSVMSGLYIEYVWNKSDEDFKSYMDWVKNLIIEKS